ncbi:MAG: EamA family transporter [Candidatus Limnocylindrales bacterium]|jgi:drug/metabolite transporter (DMT)-like permease
MVPVLGGLGAALMFTVSVLASARASRLIGASSTVAWAMAVGFIVTMPVALVVPPAPDFSNGSLPWFFVSGIGNVAGLLLTYAAYRIGAVAVIVTIASTEGAIAAILAVIAGEVLVPGAAPILALIAVGVAVTAAGATSGAEGVPISRERELRTVVLAIGSAACFGIGLYASGRLSSLLPIPWAILPPRVVGSLVLVLPLIFMRRLRLTRAAAPYVIAVGLAEVFGYISFVIGAQQAIAISAVLATMFAPFSAIAAYFLFRERLVTRQVVGIVFVVVGVAILGIVQS